MPSPHALGGRTWEREAYPVRFSRVNPEQASSKGLRLVMSEETGYLEYLSPSEHPNISRDLGPARASRLQAGAVSRRKFLRLAGGVLATTTTASAAYGGLIERNHVVVRRLEIPLTRLPESWDGATIAQLSDLHYDPRWSAGVIQHAIEVVNLLRPDLIALTGDYVTVPVRRVAGQKLAQEAEPCAQLVRNLEAPLGVFGVLGNHDAESRPSYITEIMQAAGVQILRNAAFPLERGSARVWIVGLEDALSGKQDLDTALRNVAATEVSVLLVHEPDFADVAASSPVDLQLSGHSHGGQIRLPLLGPPYLPYLARKYPVGLYSVGNMKLYTNAGLGTIRLPIRLFAPPEITLFTLRAAAARK